MVVIKYKPISVNKVWQGRRFKTRDYKDYEQDLLLILPKQDKCYDTPISITYKFYLKNHKMTDVDNLIKPLQDVLQKAGYFKDDRFIYKIEAEKIASDIDYIEVDIKEIC